MTSQVSWPTTIPDRTGFDELVELEPEARNCPFPIHETL